MRAQGLRFTRASDLRSIDNLYVLVYALNLRSIDNQMLTKQFSTLRLSSVYVTLAGA